MKKLVGMSFLLFFCSIFLFSCQEQTQDQCSKFNTNEEKIDCCIHSSNPMPLPDCNGEWVINDNGSCLYQCDEPDELHESDVLDEPDESDVSDELEFIEECDALSPCPVGECYIFPDDSNAICYEGNPCDECGSKECIIAESYPMQVFCE